jgi:ribokinase
MKFKNDVFGVGQCSLDYIALTPSYPSPDVKCEVTSLTIQGGGPVATALVALSRWGLDCFMAGVAGDDDFGRKILKSLEEEGVDTGGVQIRGCCQSQFAFVISEPTSARRTIFWQRPTGFPLRPQEINLEVLYKSSALHTDGLFPEASLFACLKAKAVGIPVIVDAGTLRDGMLDIAKTSDCFIASEVFSRAYAETPEETCRKLADLGVKWAGVTLGAQGSVALIDGRWIRQKACPVKAIDTTGCGDIFHAAITYAIVKGWGAEKAMDLASWAAGQVSTKIGGRSGIPEKKRLDEKFGDL